MSLILPMIFNSYKSFVKKLNIILKTKGFTYFFKKYLLEKLLRILCFGPHYITMRSVEFYLPASHKRKYTLPNYLQLEPTSRCNMQCRNCTRDTLSRFGDLDLDSFFYIVKQFPFLKEVKLQGLGEPLLNDSLFDMASFLKKKRTTTYIATNGTLMTKQIALNMIKYFDKIEISIDSSDRYLFRDIRGRDCFDEVLRSTRLLRSVNKNSDIAINFVMEKANMSELPAMIKLAHDLKLDHINVVSLQNWVNPGSKHKDKRREILERRIEDDRRINHELKEAMMLAKSFNMYLDFSDSSNQKGRCFWYKRGVYISWNGYVTPCCMRPNYEEFNFGNIFEKDMRNIWNSLDYIKFRHEINDGKIPLICKGCNYI